MPNIKFSLLLFCFVAFSGFTQNLDWLINGGGIKSDKGTKIVVDSQGNSYITGYYNEEANFGPLNTGFSFTQSKEAFVAKIDPNGNYVWETHGINYYDDRGLGLTIDDLGNTYVTGTCWGGLEWDFLNVYNSTSWSDQIFLTKIDPSGNPVWMKNAGNDEFDSFLYNDDHGQDLTTDANGNIIITGFVSNYWDQPGIATFDNIVVDLQPFDSLAFVGKIDAAGNWQWVETFGGIYAQRDNAVATDDEGNIYVTGGFVETQSFGTEVLTSQGGTDIYVVKFDANGNFIWVEQAGSSLSDRGNGIVYGEDGHMYVTGEFRDICTFGNLQLDNAGGPNGRDAFVGKISKNGDWKWVRQAGSKKGKDRGNYIAANDQGNVFITGQYSGNADFGNLTVDSDGDSVQLFVAAIDTTGIWRWIVEGGGPGYDRGQGIAVDDNCNVYAIGYFQETMNVSGTTIAPMQGKDIFALKLTDACFGYDNPPPPPGPDPDDPEICNIIENNIFTPNSDMTNDILKFTTYCNVDFYAVIVNRWGTKVFETTDPQAQWDGNNELGLPVAEGVYFYKIDAYYQHQPTESKSGFLHIER